VRLPAPAYASGGGRAEQSVRDGGSPCNDVDGGGKDGGDKHCFNAAQVSRWAEVSPMSSSNPEGMTGR
jgi:hypothetical protein